MFSISISDMFLASVGFNSGEAFRSTSSVLIEFISKPKKFNLLSVIQFGLR